MINLDKLRELPRDELVKLAATQGVQVHWKAKEDTIIKAIVDKVTAQPPAVTPEEMKHVAQKPVAAVHNNTPADVEIAIADIKAKKPEFQSIYDKVDNTWYFKYKGAEECGNLAIPLRIIVDKARMVSRGRIAPLGMNHHFNDSGNAQGNSAYTNTILAG